MSRYIPTPPETRALQKRKIRRRIGFFFVLLFSLVLLLGYVGVRWSGEWLIQDQPVDHVRWAVVLDGQSPNMERTDFAVKLLTENRADSVVVLGRRVFRDRNNADFYLEDMLRQGEVDSKRIFLLYHDDDSSIEEAYSLIPALRLRGADTVLLITRGPASRRVNRIFNTLAGGSIVFLTVNVEDLEFNARTWAHTRVARKVWLKEWVTLAFSVVELWFAEEAVPLPGKPYPLQWAGSMGDMGKPAMELTPIADLPEVKASSFLEASSSSSATASSSSFQAPAFQDSGSDQPRSEKPKVEKPKPKPTSQKNEKSKSEKSKSDKGKSEKSKTEKSKSSSSKRK